MTQINKSKFCNNNNQIGIFNKVVNGVVLVNMYQFALDLERFNAENENEYKKFGGKVGFAKYLEKHLQNEDVFFKKNPKKITLLNERYQNFCTDMILYEIVNTVATGQKIKVLDRNRLDDFAKVLNQKNEYALSSVLNNALEKLTQ